MESIMIGVILSAIGVYFAFKLMWNRNVDKPSQYGRRWAAWPTIVAAGVAGPLIASGSLEGLASGILLLASLFVPFFVFGCLVFYAKKFLGN